MTDTHRLLRQHAPRTWQRMLSGRRLNLLEPSPIDVEITDIALGLARNTRWNGQTIGDHAWSIAQHSDLVVDIMRGFRPKPPPWVLMAGKLHDASEYVTHDLITPLKAVVGDVFREVEARLTEAIHIRFGVPARLDPEIKALIKKADQIAAATEAVQLAGFTADELKPVLGIKARPLPKVVLTPLPSREAERRFLDGFRRLEQEMALAGPPRA
ncbi:MAG: HD family hydrolase [Caenispirillum bisanense]|nr:HD family hydrolase [Caenispirillum bisanense]MCA1974049.1 HD family hydrolase [Caenispirillum sp.]